MTDYTHVGATGVRFRLKKDSEGYVLNHEQHIQPITDANSRLASHEQYGTRHMGAKLVARVPDLYYYIEWPQEFFRLTGKRKTEAPFEYRQFFLNKLDERDFQKYRVDSGKIGAKPIHNPISVAVKDGIRSGR